MADEIGIMTRLQLFGGGITDSKSHSAQDDQATFGRYQGTVNLTTSAVTALDTGEVSDPGWFLIHNLDTAKTVSWGIASGVTPFEVPPECSVAAKLATGQSLYAKTSSTTSFIELTLMER